MEYKHTMMNLITIIRHTRSCIPFSLVLCFFLTGNVTSEAQTLSDDFEGNGNITTWQGDDCDINTTWDNPFRLGINTSDQVLYYGDTGGQYANVRFDADKNFDLSDYSVFSLKIFIPSGELTGNAPLQVSLKLQDGTLPQPWSTQSEIIKNIVPDQWQTVTFDFENDAFINLNGASPPPVLRKDFNRVVIQVNGENNSDKVVAYLDDFYYFSEIVPDVVYDHLIWSDEFDYNGPVDSDKWHHQTRLPNGDSWFNGEIQHYTDRLENSRVENGVLKITALRENFRDQGVTKTHTSARLNSKFAFTYGKVEIRAKLPSGAGTWPALWMLGKNISETGGFWDEQGFGTTPWPACGEIDIMEHWGHNQNFVQSAIHTPSSFGATVNHGGQVIPTVSTDFHVYTLEWTPDKLVFSVDDRIHYTYDPDFKNRETWPFDEEQYILMNIAIQPSISPSWTRGAMEIDYVRIYQESPITSVEILENSSLVLYPNPVDDHLTIKLNRNDHGVADVLIYDATGDIVHSQNYHTDGRTLTIQQLGHLKSGVYIVRYSQNARSQTVRFVKN